MAFVTRQVEISLMTSARTRPQIGFYFEGGIASFVKYLTATGSPA
jgi:DNA gyrase/topoisomerase IV subunit B